MRKIQLLIKRILDIILSLFGLIILSPVFILVFVLVYFKLGKPIFFIQKRPGKNEEIFKMIKFRTMLNKIDDNGNLLSDEKRITKFGKLLRSTSLDELPELINVLKGDMSLVGPRPLLVEYLSLYNKYQARRHEMKPGITGLAQINGRNAITWEEKFEYDINYIDKFNLLLDLKIIFKTVIKVLKKENVNHQDHETMSKFRGNDNKN